MYYDCGGEWGPVTFPAFKAGDSSLRGWNGGFDFHTPPPNCFDCNQLTKFAVLIGTFVLIGPLSEPFHHIPMRVCDYVRVNPQSCSYIGVA